MTTESKEVEARKAVIREQLKEVRTQLTSFSNRVDLLRAEKQFLEIQLRQLDSANQRFL